MKLDFIYGNQNKILRRYYDKWLSEEDNALYLLVGQSGSGKTTILRQLYREKGEEICGWIDSDMLEDILINFNSKVKVIDGTAQMKDWNDNVLVKGVLYKDVIIMDSPDDVILSSQRAVSSFLNFVDYLSKPCGGRQRLVLCTLTPSTFEGIKEYIKSSNAIVIPFNRLQITASVVRQIMSKFDYNSISEDCIKKLAESDSIVDVIQGIYRIKEQDRIDNAIVFCTRDSRQISIAGRVFKDNIQFNIYNQQCPAVKGSLKEVALAKAKAVFEYTGKPSIAVASGFFINKLNGFPGENFDDILDCIGVEGIINLMHKVRKELRTAYFKDCLVYYDGTTSPLIFNSFFEGAVANEKRGRIGNDWADLSYIFIPNGMDKTMAELNKDETRNIERERDKFSVYQQFLEWYINR